MTDIQVEFVPGEWVTVETVRSFFEFEVARAMRAARRRWSTMNLRRRKRRGQAR